MLSIRLIDFNISNISNIVDEDIEIDEEEENNNKSNIDNTNFTIQIFGLDENKNTISLMVTDFKPYFFLKVDEKWDERKKNNFIDHLKQKVGNYYGKEKNLLFSSIHKIMIYKIMNIQPEKEHYYYQKANH